jgi:malate dehydrogenase
VISKGEYGTPVGIITSMPVKVDAIGKWRVVEGIKLTDYAKEKIAASNKELLEEREVAFGQLGLSI